MAGDVGPAVQPRVLGAAVGGDQRGAAPHMLAVVEPEVAGHAGQQHAVGLAQRVAALVAHLQRVVAAQQAARHARQIDRHAQRCHGGGQRVGFVGLAPPPGCRSTISGRSALCSAAGARRSAPSSARGAATARGCGGGVLSLPSNMRSRMPVQVPAQRAVGQGCALAGGVGIPLADRGFVVQQVHRAFDEHRAGHAGLRQREGLGHCRAQVAHAPHLQEALDMRRRPAGAGRCPAARRGPAARWARRRRSASPATAPAARSSAR